MIQNVVIYYKQKSMPVNVAKFVYGFANKNTGCSLEI